MLTCTDFASIVISVSVLPHWYRASPLLNLSCRTADVMNTVSIHTCLFTNLEQNLHQRVPGNSTLFTGHVGFPLSYLAVAERDCNNQGQRDQVLHQTKDLEVPFKVRACSNSPSWIRYGTKELRLPPRRSAYLIFVSIWQRLGGFCFFRKTDVEAEHISLAIARRIMFTNGLVELSAFLTAPRVAKFVIP